MMSPLQHPGKSDLATGDDAMPTRLSMTVYENILNMIEQGNFGPNRRLPSETRLGEICGASRPVVREALARLRRDGVIVSRKGSGSYVQQRPKSSLLTIAPVSSIADIQRCFEFRRGVEPAAVALAARNWTREDIQRIDAALAALEMCIKTAGSGTEDAQFHEAIVQASRNPYHISIQKQLRPHLMTAMNLTRSLSPEQSALRFQKAQDEHLAIVRAVRKRDDQGAFEAMKAHIEAAQNRLFNGLGS